jgi:hypothetical protein
MKVDGSSLRKIALYFHLTRSDDAIACDTYGAPAGTEPRHSAILLREIAGEDLRADAAPEIIYSVIVPRLAVPKRVRS